MIPTNHFRWWTDLVQKPPVLQQLWISVKSDEPDDMERILNWPPAELEDWRHCEWIPVPLVVQPPAAQSTGNLAADHPEQR